MTMQPTVVPDELIRTRHAEGDLAGAASLILEHHGPHIARFLASRLRTQSDAEDAFSQFCENLWRGLPDFRWQASMRVWLFILAKNVATQLGTRRRDMPLSTGADELLQLQQAARSTTARYLRSDVKDVMRDLRLLLDDDEQALLILRVDRGLPWSELALILGEANEQSSDEDTRRAAARMRTRFQAAKRRLRDHAEAAGLLNAR